MDLLAILLLMLRGTNETLEGGPFPGMEIRKHGPAVGEGGAGAWRHRASPGLRPRGVQEGGAGSTHPLSAPVPRCVCDLGLHMLEP